MTSKARDETGSDWTGTSDLPTDYLDRLKSIQDARRPASYLEIGVHDGRSLALAGSDTTAVGIDPAPELSTELPPNARVVEMTSDAFFAGQDVLAPFGGQRIDLVFVDGMHLFEFALRDVANAMIHAAPDALILLHDTLPWNAMMAQRTRETQAWTGDVWKIGACLHRVVPTARVVTLDVAPTGLTAITGFAPEAGARLREAEPGLFRELEGAGFDYFEAVGRARLNVVPDTPASLSQIISGAGGG